MTRSPDRGTSSGAIGVRGARLLGDRYELGERLGDGGMGVVYRARDAALQRTVAVKVFREGATEPARTTSETHLLAGLNHPSLVTLFDAHVTGPEPRYIVMEYVDGPTLHEKLESGPLAPRTAARVARDLGDALHVVHQAGIVHRDIKPANVLLRHSTAPGEEFHAKLADFGIAYLIDSTRLTTPGTVVGSAAYLSPEQVTGSAPLPASDIYSLGLVLLEALTGTRAYPQPAGHESALARLTQDPVIPSSVGSEWGALLTAMTARDPGRRPSALDVVVGISGLRTSSAVAGADATVADAPGPTDAADDERSGTGRRTRATPALPPTAVLDERAATDSSSASRNKAEPARRFSTAARWLVLVIAVLALSIVAVVGAFVWPMAAEPAPRPALPAVEEPLAPHLQQLLDAVSP